MNPQSPIESAEILLQVAKGRKGEYLSVDGKWHQNNFETLCTMSGRGCKIRLVPLSFPSLPEGEEWHNPRGLTADQVETGKGWRLLLKSEIDGAEESGLQFWNGRSFVYSIYSTHKGSAFRGISSSCRTKRPLPEKKPKFEVGKKYKMRGGGWAIIEEIDTREGLDYSLRGKSSLWASECWTLDGKYRKHAIGPDNCDLLPEEVTFKKVRISSEDWKGKPVVWVRSDSNSNKDRFVTVISPSKFYTEGCDWYWESTAGMTYSFDRVTWHPFEKEVEA